MCPKTSALGPSDVMLLLLNMLCLILLNVITCISEVTIIRWSIPVAARSNAWVCGQSLAGIVGSNPAEGVSVCRFYLLFVVM
jgi:hypothetical protein